MCSKGPDKDTCFELEEIDVIILTCRNDETSRLDGLLLNNLDCVNDCSMGNDKIFLQKEVGSGGFVEIYFRNVPEFHLTRSITGDEIIIIFRSGDGGESIV